MVKTKMFETEKYKVTVKGVRPLLHNAWNAEEKKKRKSNYDPAEDAQKALYLNKGGVPVQPAVHFEGSMIQAAKMFKWKGRKTLMDVFKSSVFVSPEDIPFEVPEDPLNYVIDKRRAVIKQSAITKSRPRWDDWQFTFTVSVLQPENLTGDQLNEVLEHAGAFVGIGDFRPKFGLFKIEHFEKLS